MPYRKISSKVDDAAWRELEALAKETHAHISDLLTEAISEYVRRRRVRPEVLLNVEQYLDENEDLGCRLAE